MPRNQTVQLLMCGDVMLGRGIDQILRDPCDPILHEKHMRSALDYISLAERAHGPIARGLPGSYVWGAALDEFTRDAGAIRIINLETSITRSDDYDPKGINYRVSPENAGCLIPAKIDCCALANNHVLDWGQTGLCDTLSTLKRLGIKTVGAGVNEAQASAPAFFSTVGGGRVLVYALASTTSGTPRRWAATCANPGVNIIPDLTHANTCGLIDRINRERKPNDIIVVSIHWGTNWGYSIDSTQIEFAHSLITRAGVSVIHGHSSHHAKAIELYRQGVILYGCGDFVNDYEGIAGYDQYHGDLSLMYLVTISLTAGNVLGLDIAPFKKRRFNLVRADEASMNWLMQTLDHESEPFGVRIVRTADFRLSAQASAR